MMYVIDLLQALLEWYLANLNYFTVALLMAVESTFIPFPSEMVIPFAAYKAGQGDLNIYFVIISGTAGALCGSLINYYFARYLGRPLVYKFAGSRIGRIFLLSEKKIEKAENFFIQNGKSSTFIGRLVPVVRQLISIPAGLAKMNLYDFIIYTVIGAGIWNIILAVIGYFLYEIKDRILPFIGHIMIVLGIAFIIYLIIRGRRKKA